MANYRCILLFSDADLLFDGLRIQDEAAVINLDTHVLDQHWPLNREKNLAKLISHHNRYPRVTIHNAGENLGIHRGFNYLMKVVNLQDDDIMITTAPDTAPITTGWDKALIDVMKTAPYLAMLSCTNKDVDETPNRQWRYSEVAGYRVAFANEACGMYGAAAYRGSFLRRIGGFYQNRPYYGGIEAEMLGRARQLGMTCAYLPDYRESYELQNRHPQVYTDYKWIQGHENSFQGSFADYLVALENGTAPKRTPT